MDIQIDGLLRSFIGDLFRQEDADLAEIFFLNVITKRVYTEYCEKFSGAKPTQIMIRGILQNTELNATEAEMVLRRVMYWLNKQQEKNWTDEIGFERSRRTPPKLKSRKGQCNWPGCNELGKLEVDHKFPYSLGGDDEEVNFQLLCKSCNIAKGNSIFSINEWPCD